MPSPVTFLQHQESTLSSEKIKQFQKKVLSFYKKNKRSLPWRNTTDPYKILLSEFMLQQTQVSRVVSYYERWTAKWPTINQLASAPLAEVLTLWMGLGYNNRAVNLHRTAKKIVAEFDGDVITAMKNYEELPGIGKYTSQAVQIFSTNDDLVTVDTNIRRIFIREFNLPPTVPDNELWRIAELCLPKNKSRRWHNALMDYGALYLTAKKTGIKPKTQQSRFEGSNRQIRAAIVRYLLKEALSVSELERKIGVEKSRLLPLLEKMSAEQILVKHNTVYQIND